MRIGFLFLPSMDIPELYKIFSAYPSISTDTRKDPNGSIFFCLKGPNFDANTFAEQALKNGAALVVSDDTSYAGNDKIAIVDDVLICLQELASHHRDQFIFPVIGLTGSNGKTTNKELMLAVLSRKYNTFATKGNLNNHIGVPLTLLSIPLNAELALVEMGANHQGEIRDLCQISKPDYGLITNIGKAHLEGFGGIEGVIKGKKELYDFIQKNNGEVFVNADDALLMELSSEIKRHTYGKTHQAEVKGVLIKKGQLIAIQVSDTTHSSSIISTQLVGDYNFTNLLAAAAIGLHFEVTFDDIVIGLSGYQPDNNRSQLVDTGRNKLILDAYNANPSSVSAAITNFAESGTSSKTVLLGQMMELGDESIAEHQQIIDLLQQLNLDSMLVGKQFAACDLKGFSCFETVQELKVNLKKNPLTNRQILVKGSRSMTMEKVLEDL